MDRHSQRHSDICGGLPSLKAPHVNLAPMAAGAIRRAIHTHCSAKPLATCGQGVEMGNLQALRRIEYAHHG